LPGIHSISSSPSQTTANPGCKVVFTTAIAQQQDKAYGEEVELADNIVGCKRIVLAAIFAAAGD
jgi:hypothetical protein